MHCTRVENRFKSKCKQTYNRTNSYQFNGYSERQLFLWQNSKINQKHFGFLWYDGLIFITTILNNLNEVITTTEDNDESFKKIIKIKQIQFKSFTCLHSTFYSYQGFITISKRNVALNLGEGEYETYKKCTNVELLRRLFTWRTFHKNQRVLELPLWYKT